MATTALKKITAEAKRIRKKKPKTSWKSAVKQAGAKYRSGKIRGPKKVGARKKRSTKKRAVRKKAAPKKRSRKRSSRRKVGQASQKQVVRVVRVTKVGRVSSPRRHRMAGGGGMKKIMPFLLLGGVALIAYHLLKPKPAQLPPGVPPLAQTSNQYRNDQTNSILQYALAGGLAIDAITRLINSLNSRNDSDIQNIYDEVNQGGGLPPTLFV